MLLKCSRPETAVVFERTTLKYESAFFEMQLGGGMILLLSYKTFKTEFALIFA